MGEVKVAKRRRVRSIRLSLPHDHDNCHVETHKHSSVKKRASGQPAWRIAGMADLNRREKLLADVIMECWTKTQPLVDTLITESFPIGPSNTTILDDESRYNLQVTMIVESFQEAFAEILLEQYVDSGEYSMREFTKQLSKAYKRFKKSSDVRKADEVLPSEAILRFRFDRTSPTAEAYAVKSSASMVSDISDSNITGVRALVGRAFQEQRTYQQTATALTALLSETVPLNSVSQRLGQIYGINANGLFPRYANAVANFAERTALDLADRGITGSKALKVVQDRSDKYAQKLRRSRAKMISRTEIMRANNSGRLAAADQAAAKGLFDKTKAKRQWLSAPQDSCFICGPLNEVAVDYNQTWFEGEPAYVHPNCRCTWILLPNVPVNGIPTVTGTGTAANPFVWNFANQNRSLAPMQTGGTTATGAANTIPEPKPLQSTTITDEVAEIADEAVPVVDDVTDELRGHADIDDFVDNFVWNDEGQTWAMLDEDDQRYFTELMIDAEISKGVDGINQFSAFQFDEQGYTLMANAPEGVASEILELQRDVFEKVQAVERNRKIRSLQVSKRAKTEADTPKHLQELFEDPAFRTRADESLVEPLEGALKAVDYIPDIQGKTLSGRQLNYLQGEETISRNLISNELGPNSGKTLNWNVVNERLRRWSFQAEEIAEDVADEAVAAIKKLGDAMEREVHRRVDEIIGSGASIDEIAQARKTFKSQLDEIKVQFGETDSKFDTEWYNAAGESIFVDRKIATALKELKDLEIPAGVDFSGVDPVLLKPRLLALKKGDTVSSVFSTSGPTGRRAGFNDWDDLIEVLSNGDPVDIDTFTDIVDMMDQLIMINNSTSEQFLTQRIIASYDEAVQAMANKVDNMFAPNTSESFVNNQIIGNKIEDIKVLKRKISATTRDQAEILDLLQEIDPTLATEVKPSSIDALETLIEDWLSVEIDKFAPSIDAQTAFLFDEFPLSSRRGANNQVLDIPQRQLGMEERLQRLRELIAEAEQYPVGSPERLALTKANRDRFFGVVDDFTHRHAIAGQNLTLRTTNRAVPVDGGTRSWSLRGGRKNSASRVEKKLLKINEDFRSQITEEMFDVLEVLDDSGMPIANSRVNEVFRRGSQENAEVQRVVNLVIDGNEPAFGSQFYARLGLDSELHSTSYRDTIYDIMKGDLKTVDNQYSAMDLLMADLGHKTNYAKLLDSAKTENLGGAGLSKTKAELGLIRQKVLQEARETGGSLSFESGVELSSNVKATKKLSSKCGERLEYDIIDPKTGEVLAERGSKITPKQYEQYAQMYADDAMDSVPSAWAKRLNDATDLDAGGPIDPIRAGHVKSQKKGSGNRAFYGSETKDFKKNHDKYERKNYHFTTDKTAPDRAHAFYFDRNFDAQYAKGYDWTSQMDDIPDTILMVADDKDIRGGYINITYNDLNRTTMGHELQHLFQKQNGTFTELESAWYRQRVASSGPAGVKYPERVNNPAYKPQKIYQGRKEVSIPDEIQNMYTTKYYDNAPHGWTEDFSFGDRSPIWDTTMSNTSGPLATGSNVKVGSSEWFAWNHNSESLAMSFQDMFDRSIYTGNNGVKRTGNLPRYAEHFDEAGKRLAEPILGEVDDDLISFFFGMYGGI